MSSPPTAEPSADLIRWLVRAARCLLEEEGKVRTTEQHSNTRTGSRRVESQQVRSPVRRGTAELGPDGKMTV